MYVKEASAGEVTMAPKKLYKIGEIIRYTRQLGWGPDGEGLSRQTIHNYTVMGLIREAERTESGHRLYGEDVFEQLGKIEMLKRHRTLREVMEMLKKEVKEPKAARS
ncbi:MAG: MerR family DNA-binding transcriptional regulator [Planctomycetes bacterium]|nr:MerR family DNA-binding transcriptional regulator [Planctomycetota bacterium]